MKQKLKVAWDIIVYKMKLLLTRSNEPGPVSLILDSWIWILDFDLATLDDIIVYGISSYNVVFWSEKAVFSQNVIVPDIFSFQ